MRATNIFVESLVCVTKVTRLNGGFRDFACRMVIPGVCKTLLGYDGG